MSGYLLDTHVVVWWLSNSRQLSKEQRRVLGSIDQKGGRVQMSAVTLLEIAILYGVGNRKHQEKAQELIQFLEDHPLVEIVPLTPQVAVEVGTLGPSLVDPMDRAIVATARVHRLTLITSDERIIKSKLVRVIE